MGYPQLIVMLTHHDRTVVNASEIFEICKHSKAQYWGFKEDGLPSEQMYNLFAAMKACGKTTVLEVVAYTEEECLHGAHLAVQCGCDILMGTLFFDSVNDYCKQNSLKYMPFVGKISQRPSVLDGTVEEMVQEAESYLQKGVYGLDLLGYRYTGDPNELIRQFVSRVDAPVCVAGSINTLDRVDCVVQAGAWAFTIGGAFFESKFGDTFAGQINLVCSHLERKSLSIVG